MWDFSDDEILFGLASAVVAASVGVPLWSAALRIGTLGRSMGRRLILLLVPIVAAVPTLITMNLWADSQVAGHLDYNVLFLLGQMALLAVCAKSLPLFGFHLRDDVIERDNPAALIATVGALLAVSLIYALANIGTGPTIWTTILPAIAATIALWALAMVIHLFVGDLRDVITIDRDLASAIRFSGAMLAMGLILGRAAAGNFADWERTGEDLLAFGVPAMFPAAMAIVLQHVFSPQPLLPRPDVLRAGVWPAAGIIAIAIGMVFLLPHGWHVGQW